MAVRLTDEESIFSDRWIANINAYGISYGSASANARASSAGTVYLVNGSRDADAGVIYVRNDMLYARAEENNAVTCIPGTDESCDDADALRNTTLSLDGAGKVKLTADITATAFTAVSKTKLDLAGRSYIVNVAYVNGRKVPIGTYIGGDDPFGDILTDTVGGGTLRVTGYGLWVFIQ